MTEQSADVGCIGKHTTGMLVSEEPRPWQFGYLVYFKFSHPIESLFLKPHNFEVQSFNKTRSGGFPGPKALPNKAG